MKPRNYPAKEFQNICNALTNNVGFVYMPDSDGKNGVVYSTGKKVFFPVRREYQPESDEMFLWQILFPEDIIRRVHPEIFHFEAIGDKIEFTPNIIWSGKSPKGQEIFWCDNNTSDGVFFAEFDLGGKLFWEEVIPCKEERIKISQQIVME